MPPWRSLPLSYRSNDARHSRPTAIEASIGQVGDSYTFATRRAWPSVTSSPDGIRRLTGSVETVPASTTTLTLCHYVIVFRFFPVEGRIDCGLAGSTATREVEGR